MGKVLRPQRARGRHFDLPGSGKLPAWVCTGTEPWVLEGRGWELNIWVLKRSSSLVCGTSDTQRSRPGTSRAEGQVSGKVRKWKSLWVPGRGKGWEAGPSFSRGFLSSNCLSPCWVLD